MAQNEQTTEEHSTLEQQSPGKARSPSVVRHVDGMTKRRRSPLPVTVCVTACVVCVQVSATVSDTGGVSDSVGG